LNIDGIPVDSGLPGHHILLGAPASRRRVVQGDGLVNRPARRRRSQVGAADPISGCFPAGRSCFFASLHLGGFALNVLAGYYMTTANKITILRILLIPFFVVELIYYLETGNEVHRLLALLSFAVTAILDGVDGYIARRYNQKSELGAILDPLADKMLLVSGIITLSFNHGSYIGQIPLWLTGTILGRDLLLLIGIAVIRLTVGKVIVRPRFMGKIATVLQMIVVLWILLDWDRELNARWLKIWTLGAAVCTGVSGLLYIWDGVKQLGAHPASSPTKTGATDLHR
jgi:CDP-diacylglycerol--glycerol-3-phosphate 3-phosphatidyltransferase